MLLSAYMGSREILPVIEGKISQIRFRTGGRKTSIIEFGRFAASNRKKAGKGKPKTFDFLSFTHYGSRNRNGKFRVK